nr:hypothetical protein [Klebsiella pneumoniae]
TSRSPAMSGADVPCQEGGWSDVTLGADMRLGSHVAAWATLSQADNLPSENTLYLMGVSANF